MTLLRPHQYGIALRGGLETLTTELSIDVDHTQADVVISLDAKNAFNTLSRTVIKQRIQEANLVEFIPYMHCMYGTPSRLFCKGTGRNPLFSSTGVQQGDPLGPAAFCVGIHKTLAAVALQHPDVRLYAYLDDIYVAGDMNSALTAVASLISSLAEIGLVINKAKSRVLRCHNVSLDDLRNQVAALTEDEPDEHGVVGDNHSLAICDDDLVIVCVPFGSAQFKRDFLHKQVEEWSRQLVCLDHLSSTQYKSLLFRWCILSKATFLMRNVSPSIAHPAWQAWDTILKTFISQSLLGGVGEFSDHALLQLQLPVGKGGFGFNIPSMHAPAAYLAGFSLGLQSRGDSWDPEIWDAPYQIFQDVLIAYSCHRHFCEASALLPSQFSVDWFALNKVDQRKLAQEVHVQIFNLYQQFAPEIDKSRLRSLSDPNGHAGDWLLVTPTEARLRLANEEFRFASKLRLGLPIAHLPDHCPCSHSNHESQIDLGLGYHSLTCRHRRLTWFIPRHNWILSTWSRTLRLPAFLLMRSLKGCSLGVDLTMKFKMKLKLKMTMQIPTKRIS